MNVYICAHFVNNFFIAVLVGFGFQNKTSYQKIHIRGPLPLNTNVLQINHDLAIVLILSIFFKIMESNFFDFFCMVKYIQFSLLAGGVHGLSFP